MKLLVVLLFISTANIVHGNKWTEIEFPPKILAHDLDVIGWYDRYVSSGVHAYVHLPNGISFHVSKEKSELFEKHLKIEGIFRTSADRDTSYNGLYFGWGKFYVLKKRVLNPVDIDAPVYYSQPKINLPKKHLSIRYFGLEEITDMIKSFCTNNEAQVSSWDKKEAVFLAIASGTGIEHFIEYSFITTFARPPEADGKLLVMIGTEEEPGKLKLSESIEARRLLFNQRDQTAIIPHAENPDSTPLKNVFGVRMAYIGFMAEVQESGVKMFNFNDFPLAPHEITVRRFLEKVRHVEPRFINLDSPDRDELKMSDFQVLGHMLTKQANPVRSSSKTEAEICPLIVKYKTKGSYFLYGNNKVNHLCTDDVKIWVLSDSGQIVLDNSLKKITLAYPEAN